MNDVNDQKAAIISNLRALEGTDEIYIDIYDSIVFATDRAYQVVSRYLSEYPLEDDRLLAVQTLAQAYINIDATNTGSAISQQTQGSRSVSYKVNVPELDSSGLSADVRTMLPKPPVGCYT